MNDPEVEWVVFEDCESIHESSTARLKNDRRLGGARNAYSRGIRAEIGTVPDSLLWSPSEIHLVNHIF